MNMWSMCKSSLSLSHSPTSHSKITPFLHQTNLSLPEYMISMAFLQLQVSSLNSAASTWQGKSPIISTAAADVVSWGCFSGGERRTRKEKIGGSRTIRCMSMGESAGVTVTVGKVTEVGKDTFWPLVHAAGDKTVVLDMYTQWCGPCKVMAPKFQQLSEKYSDVIFLKLDCNQDNKPLAKELGIRVVPTFKILKDNKVVKEVTGAKFDDLVSAIEIVRSS